MTDQQTSRTNIITEDDWPRCKRCGLHEWEHGAAIHKMAWPPLTKRELRVLAHIEEELR